MAGVIYKRSGTRVLRRMDRRARERVAKAVDQLEADPDREDLDIKPIPAIGGFRLRIGDWRVLYDRVQTEGQEEEIIIQAIRQRGQAYRR